MALATMLCACLTTKASHLPSSPTTLYVINHAVFFVSSNGNVTNSGTQLSPWSFSYALTQLAPGVTVTLMPGLYTGPWIIPTNVTGTSLYPATIKSQIKWGAVLANSTTGLMHGLAVHNGYSPYLVIDGLCVSNNMGNGIAVNYGSTIKNCWITGNHLQGLDLSNPACSNNTVEYNLVENNGVRPPTQIPPPGHFHGLYLSGPNNIVRGNVFRNHTNGYGMIVYSKYPGDTPWNDLIYNNLMYGNTSRWALAIYSAGDYSGSVPGTNYCFNNTLNGGIFAVNGTTIVSNNIILPSPIIDPKDMIQTSSPYPAIIADYNLSTLAIAPKGSGNIIGSHNVVSSSIGFENTNSGLYWLSGVSPAKGLAGTNLIPPVDFFGNPQSSVTDVGAFQYNAAMAADTRVLYSPPMLMPDYWVAP